MVFEAHRKKSALHLRVLIQSWKDSEQPETTSFKLKATVEIL
jgi:hypothetical protein